MSMVIYGLATCDGCRKARKALESAGHAVVFRDVRAEPLAGEDRRRFLAAFGSALVNQRSTTWRGLEDAERALDADTLLSRYPALMKRPVIEADGALHLGWGKDSQTALGV